MTERVLTVGPTDIVINEYSDFTFSNLLNTYTNEDTPIQSSRGIGYDPYSDEIYVTGLSRSRVYKGPLGGELSSVISPSSSNTALRTSSYFNSELDLLTLFEFNGQGIVSFRASTGDIIQTITGYTRLRGSAFNYNNGRLYFTSNLSDGGVVLYSCKVSTSGVSEIQQIATFSDLSVSNGLAVSSEGRIYTVNDAEVILLNPTTGGFKNVATLDAPVFGICSMDRNVIRGLSEYKRDIIGHANSHMPNVPEGIVRDILNKLSDPAVTLSLENADGIEAYIAEFSDPSKDPSDIWMSGLGELVATIVAGIGVINIPDSTQEYVTTRMHNMFTHLGAFEINDPVGFPFDFPITLG